MPGWLTPQRAFAFAGLAALLIVGILSLTMIAGAGGDEEEPATAAAEATATPTPTPTPEPTPTPTPTPVPLTPEEKAQREAAGEQVRQQGFDPTTLRAYHPDQTLRVLLGENESGGRRAFFFVGDAFVGSDAPDPSAKLTIVRQTENTVTLVYTLNTGEKARVRFRWDGTSLAPAAPVPPFAERQA